MTKSIHQQKIVWVLGGLNSGGLEWQLLQLAPALRAKGITVSIFTTSYSGTLLPLFLNQGIKVTTAKIPTFIKKLPLIGRALGYALSLLQLTFYLLIHRPKIVHSFMVGPYLLSMLASIWLPNCKRIMSRRIYYVSMHKKGLLYPIEKCIHPFLHRAVANSSDIMKQLAEEGIANQKLALIYNGLNLERFSQVKSRTQVRAALAIPDEDLIFIQVANLRAQKAHELSLKALANALPHIKQNCHLLCVGRDDGRLETLQSLCEDLQITAQVQWLGQRTDVPDLLNASDIGLLCSYAEGFSNSLLESMYSGLPMIVSDVSGSNEAVVHQRSGWIVPRDNHKAITEAIVTLSSSLQLRQNFGSQAKQRVLEHFTIEQAATSHIELYSNLLAPLELGVTT